MIYRAETNLRLHELRRTLDYLATLINSKVSKTNPAFLVANLLNGDIKCYSKPESLYDVVIDPQYLVVEIDREVDQCIKFMFLNRILQLNFAKEAVEIVRARISLRRKSKEDLYVSYDLNLGYVDVITQTEYDELIEGCTDEEISRIVALPLSSSAKDNLPLIRGDNLQLSKQIFHSL